MAKVTQLGATLALLGTAHAALNTRLLRRPTPGASTGRRVSVLIPARDEAANIVDCLAALRGQQIAEIVVFDDGSRDETADLAAGSGAWVMIGSPPPPGWLGKPYACAQLAAAADPNSDVLVFLDADVRLGPGAIAAAVALLDESGLDMITPHPRQIAVTPAERLVQPLLQWSFLTMLPLRIAERSARPSLGAAIGQFVVITREAYERAGGHNAVRGAVLDDIALLRAVKASGGRGSMVDGSGIATCRMYAGWGELRDGYGKSLWAAVGSPAGAAAVVGALGVVYVVPALAALRGKRAGLLGYLAAVAGRAVTARATGGRAWPDALAHPISIGAFGYLTARSVVQRRRGRLRWKGRTL